jgi:hypothetical protein
MKKAKKLPHVTQNKSMGLTLLPRRGTNGMQPNYFDREEYQ